MGKIIEGLWDCPFCGNKRIRAGQKTCPDCGHPQDENTKFYMPDEIKYVSEEEAEKISRNPDWQCSFCGSLNSDDLNVCKNCGATKEDSERNYFEMRQQEEEKMGIFAAIIFGMMSCLAPKIKNVTIDDLNWERTIDIEEVVTHNESDWSLPDDASLQYTKSEIQS